MALGDLFLAVLVTLTWGISFVAIKIGVDSFPPLFFSALRFILAAIDWRGAAAPFYVTVIGTILGFAGWGHLIARHGASPVAPFALLVPIFGMGSAALMLGERFGSTRLFGAILVLAGLTLTVWKRPTA